LLKIWLLQLQVALVEIVKLLVSLGDFRSNLLKEQHVLVRDLHNDLVKLQFRLVVSEQLPFFPPILDELCLVIHEVKWLDDLPLRDVVEEVLLQL